MINPILKVLKEGDVVLVEIPDSSITGTGGIRQIIRLKELEYEPEDSEYPNQNWLDFKGDVIYTTVRVEKESENFIFSNCMGIKEILNPFLIEKYKIDYRMFSPKENQLTKEEYEYELQKELRR